MAQITIQSNHAMEPTTRTNLNTMFTELYAAIATFLTASSTNTLTNKRITRRVVAHADTATITVDSDTTDMATVAQLSQTTAIANPTGTPTDGQKLEYRIYTSTSRSLTFGNQFRGSLDLALPAATNGGGKYDYLIFVWNAAASKWDYQGKNFGF